MKLPSVSPPTILGVCVSVLSAGWDEEGLVVSLEPFGAGEGDPVPKAGEVDFGVRENGSSAVEPKTALLLPKENGSFTGKIQV